MAESGSWNLFTNQQLIELHKQGFNDVEIAEKLGADRSTVRGRRNRLGLKPVRKHGLEAISRRRLFTDQQLKELHEQGFNDVEIGEKLGAHESTVKNHRKRLGLEPVCNKR